MELNIMNGLDLKVFVILEAIGFLILKHIATNP